MELFIALGLPIVLLVGLTLLFMTEGVPSWVQQFNRNSSTLWNFGIVAMGTMTVIIYLAKRWEYTEWLNSKEGKWCKNMKIWLTFNLK